MDLNQNFMEIFSQLLRAVLNACFHTPVCGYSHFPTPLVLILGLTISGVAGQESPTQKAYPTTTSKKGLQVELVDDALVLGVKHAALNVNLAQLAVPDSRQHEKHFVKWNFGGRNYIFNGRALSNIEANIKGLSDHGVLVYCILLVYVSSDPQINQLLLHSEYDQSAPNRLGAFNTTTPEGRAWLKATLAFLAQRWSRPDQKFGRVVGYIVGNEVNSHWWWSNRGLVTMHEFIEDYLQAVRIIHGAVRGQAPWPRIYLSLDHHWGIRYQAGSDRQAFAGKAFLDRFARRCREEGDFDWHLAFHPYPENLFEPRFWNDQSATSSFDTPRITFKNLELIVQYLKQTEFLFQESSRRVILSEQGFHTPEGSDGETIQAAAYCYAYKKVEALDGIDAFILHRHVDHPHEGGLRLGLRRYLPGAKDPRPKKRIYECFRQADTPLWEDTFQFALPLVGLEKWEQ